MRPGPVRLSYDRGSVLVETDPGDPPPDAGPGLAWDDRVGRFRAPAYRYRALRRAARAAPGRLDDRLRLRTVPPVVLSPPELRDDQGVALEAWVQAGGRGLVVMPTGAGKTRVALAAMARVGRPALVLVPTRALMVQWAEALRAQGFDDLGLLGDGHRECGPVTIATYASASRHMPRLGDRFALLVVDEVHHFTSHGLGDVLRMCAAPARLGLTATLPRDPDHVARLRDLLGEVVCHSRIGDMSGRQLAPFEVAVLHVDLDPAERVRYDEADRPLRAAWRSWTRAFPGGRWSEFLKELGTTSEGRRLLIAHREVHEVVASAARKIAIAREVLRRHSADRTLVFTASNRFAYAVSEALLIPAVTCHVTGGERRWILDAFREGALRALVSTRVLNEGLDVPDARIALILGGGAGPREHIQRVGRVLRSRPGKRALVYEVVCAGTFEQRQSFRRSLALAA